MRKRCRHVLQIDDLADRNFDSDILLDQNFYFDMDTRYDARCAAATTKLIGPQFALLNDMFGQLQSQLAPYPQRLAQGQVLFFFGGIDKDNETLKALKGVAPLLRQYQLTGQVILGKHNPHQANVTAFCRDVAQLSLAVQVDDMARRMSHAFVYIGAVGATVWERCCLALPAITSIVALNQQALAESLSQIDAHLCLGSQQQTRSADYARAFITLMNSPERLQTQSATVAQMVDALGCSRVVDVMESMNDH
jgi:spore coat polysaccharide biosynthesis predicted glycosyltransferase SpsG